MKNPKLPVLLAFALLLVVATIVGCGTLGTDGFLIPTGLAPARFAFVVNGNPDPTLNTISAFKIDSGSGMLTAVPGSPFQTAITTCCGTMFIDVDPNSKFVYVPNRGNNTVSVMSVDQNSGALTEVGTAVNSQGIEAFSAKVDPTGKFLFVVNGHFQSNGNLAAFTVSGAGALTANGNQPIGAEPYHLMMDPKGRFAYVTAGGPSGTVWGFSINATNGTLTPIPGSPFAANCESRSGTVDFTGNFLVIAVTDCNEVQVYRIDQNSGALTSLGTSPTNDRPFHVAEAAAGGNFYMVVNNLDDSNLIAFQFNDSTGALTSVGTPFSPANSNWPHFMAVDTSGKFGYVVDYGTPCCNNAFITGVTVGSNGSLAAITGSPFTTGGMRFPTQIVLGH